MRSHSADKASLVFGAIFLAVAALWLTSRVVALDAATFGWIAAAGLFALGIGLGAKAIASANASSRRHADNRRP